jgi:hypothetical protein
VRKESIVPYLQPEGTRSIVDRDATCYAALLCFALLCFARCAMRYGKRRTMHRHDGSRGSLPSVPSVSSLHEVSKSHTYKGY